MIGLMTASESGKGESPSALQAPNNCERPQCTGLWQILISSSPQPQPDTHQGSSGTQRYMSDTGELLMALKGANNVGHQLSIGTWCDHWWLSAWHLQPQEHFNKSVYLSLLLLQLLTTTAVMQTKANKFRS